MTAVKSCCSPVENVGRSAFVESLLLKRRSNPRASVWPRPPSGKSARFRPRAASWPPADACSRRCARESNVIARHQFVRDAHQFAEHVVRRIRHANVVVQALAHLLDAVQSLQDGQNKDDLLWLSLVLLQLAPDENVEELIGPAEFDIGLHLDRIPALHDGILNLVRANRLLVLQDAL